MASEVKIPYLAENYGTERSRIFHSQDLSFLGHIVRATNNRNVDLALGSLSGDLLNALWRCVAEYGAMVNVGNRNNKQRVKRAMEPLEHNRSFIGFELRLISQLRPASTTPYLSQPPKLLTDYRSVLLIYSAQSTWFWQTALLPFVSPAHVVSINRPITGCGSQCNRTTSKLREFPKFSSLSSASTT